MIAILHLSDIHFDHGSNPVCHRLELIAQAFTNVRDDDVRSGRGAITIATVKRPRRPCAECRKRPRAFGLEWCSECHERIGEADGSLGFSL